MAELQDYSPTAGSNNSASPAGWPEGMAPSGVNNSDRELAARIARERDDTQGVTADGGTANARTFAATRDTTAAYTGELFVIRSAATNTGATTINITPSGGSARGAVAIQRNGAALQGGELVNGGIYAIVYDGTNYDLVAPGILRSRFLAYASAAQDNKTGNNTVHTVIFDAEVFDDNADFASNTFTAPVGGRYQLHAQVAMFNLAGTATSITATITTGNRTYQIARHTGTLADLTQLIVNGSVVADMDAADTATVTVTVNGVGADSVDIDVGATLVTFFSGALLP